MDEVSYYEKKLKLKKKKSVLNELEKDGFGDLLADLDGFDRPHDAEVSQAGHDDDWLASKRKKRRTWKEDIAEKNVEVAASAQPIATTQQVTVALPGVNAPERAHDSTVARGVLQDDQQLTRKVKGLFNRLSEGNMEALLTEADVLFRTYPRSQVTEAMCEAILDAVSHQSGLLESFVMLYAAFLYVLTHMIGVDLLAAFVVKLVGRLQSARQSGSQDKDRISMNLIFFVAYLYIFQLLSTALVYDLVRDLVASLDEFNVELLLKLLRTSGSQLRQDDPTALRDMLVAIHGAAQNLPDESKGSRFRFMMEMLDDLKNNKRKLVKPDSESLIRWKKQLATLLKHRASTRMEPLNIRLADALNPEHLRSSKWYLVGFGARQLGGEDPLVAGVQKSALNKTEEDDELMALAESQRMNTDVRKAIFKLLMTSDDYLDAHEKLAKLRLTPTQQRDVPRVLIHCCGQELSYNPFYALVAKTLCLHDKAFPITFQYCLWDLLKTTKQEGNVRKLSHLANFFAYLISQQAVSLTVLKAAQFERIDRDRRLNLFLSLLMTDVLTTMPRKKFIGELKRITSTSKLQPFRDGLLYFMLRLKTQFKSVGLKGDALKTAQTMMEESMGILESSQASLDSDAEFAAALDAHDRGLVSSCSDDDHDFDQVASD